MNLRQFREWAIQQRSVDIPGGSLNPPGRLRGECVSLVQQYVYRVFDIPFAARGHAHQWASNPLPNDFRRLVASGNRPQAGDILVYPSTMPGSNGFGHVALIDDEGWFLDQNGIQRNIVVRRQNPIPGFTVLLRPINQARLGLESNTTTFRPGRYRVNTAVLNVRRDPSTNNPPLRFNQLTQNAQAQIRRMNNNQTANGLVKGVIVDVSEVRGVWGRIPSGWISLNYAVRV